jgi:hypothetical protein
MNRSTRKSYGIRAALSCAVALFVLTGVGRAADLAVLRNGFTIRHDHRQILGTSTRLFFFADDSSFTDVPTAEITSYEKDLSLPPLSAPLAARPAATSTAPRPLVVPSASIPTRSAADLTQVVNSASAAYHLDPDLVNSVIHAESGFNSRARSPKGAQGLMQLMPSTAGALGVANPFDPQANVGGGSRYLRELLERYNFDLVKALAAYNAGPQRVDQYRGVPPFRETRSYVARIVHDYNRKKIAQERAAAKAKKDGAPAKTSVVAAEARRNVKGQTSSGRATAHSGSGNTGRKRPAAPARQVAANPAADNSPR